MSPETHVGAIAQAAAVVPTPRQLAWQQLDFYGFIHFGMNTMTNREWGIGHEDPALFDPLNVDTDQWVTSLASAGMTGVIITAKHHDGFCLWPTATTRHSVASSPWQNGDGDLVRDIAESVRRFGLKLGVYLSPWDRTDPAYGSGTSYDDLYVEQLRELLTGYGDVFTVWLDGANGEGADGRRQQYDWERYFALVRELQPNAVISVCGPDVRWCGNEAGHTRPDEWSVVPRYLQDAERTSDRSQQADDTKFASLVRSDDQDLGSRTAIAGQEEQLTWYPAEVNTSIRPGWFHHPAEDSLVRTAQELFDIHQQSVGGNASFLLNVPPTREGLIAKPDMDVLAELGQLISSQEARTTTGQVGVSSGHFEPRQATTGGTKDFHPSHSVAVWQSAIEDNYPSMTLTFPEPLWVDGIIIREDIATGQRIERVVVVGELAKTKVSQRLASSGVIGNRRVVHFDAVFLDKIVVHIEEFRAAPRLSGLGVLEAVPVTT